MDAEDIIIKLDRISERRIRDAIEAGEFDNLEGAGKPLSLDDDSLVPKEMRAAFRILSNSGYAPDWMVLAQDIENDIHKLRNNADHHFAYLREQLAELAGNPYAVRRLRSEVNRLKAVHRRAAAQHSNLIEEVNRKISTFNQTVPITSLVKVPLSQSAEMARYEDRVPAYLTYGQ
jgi:hypothetical protein